MSADFKDFYILQTSAFPIVCLVFVGIASILLYALTYLILGRQTTIDRTFWEHQKLAESKIMWLNMLFFFMLVLLFITAFALCRVVFNIFDDKNDEMYAFISLICGVILVGIVLVAYFIKLFSMRKHSIDKLAKTLKAKELTTNTLLLRSEKVLLEVIQEMAIASNMPMPRVFVIRGEKGINAMCSGERFGKEDEQIGIFVTQGALQNFNREELQAVIGHEFSHAFHQDVALNLKIFSFVFALTCVMIAGRVLLESLLRGRVRSKNSKNGGILIIAGIALVFFVLGFIGNIFAQIIQAAISRQKEFLADATSMQYTRNPRGMKQALQKLLDLQEAQSQSIGQITNPQAKACAHMFFLNGFNQIFSTHPPLEKRLKHINSMSQ